MAAQVEGDEPDGPPAPVTFRLVGGLDISPVPLAAPAEGGHGGPAGGGAGELAVASLVVLALPALRPVYEDDVQVRLTSPYVAGFLGFRCGRDAPPTDDAHVRPKTSSTWMVLSSDADGLPLRCGRRFPPPFQGGFGVPAAAVACR